MDVKHLSLLLIASMIMAGCRERVTPKQPETQTEPKKEEPAEGEPKATTKKPIPANAFVNTLGMAFVPVPGTRVQFCIWETRAKDYAAYASAEEVNPSWMDPEFIQTATHPVVSVSWNDAQAFCAWLTKKEQAAGKLKPGQRYRLPTDAEWSLAVGLGKEKGSTPNEKQLGIKGVYPWGKEWPPPKEAGSYHKSLKVDSFELTAPVGSFAANKLGIHDLGGNVWEWCEDKWIPSSSARVLRGGSWDYDRRDGLLSSFRFNGEPGLRFLDFGFRCVLMGE